jgi:hypothetical protein
MFTIGIVVALVLFLASGNASGNQKILLIMVDNRDLDSTFHSPNMSYFPLSAAINYEYAKHHGYGFLLFNVNNNDVVSNVYSKYGVNSTSASVTADSHMKMGWATKEKQKISVFNAKLRQFRATPWAKIALMWNLVTVISQDEILSVWDFVFYLDSDFVINPKFHSRSIAEAFKSWSAHSAAVSKASMIFFSNAPYSHRPCTGGMLVSISHENSVQLLADWWNWDIPYNNFAHEYEQAALWEMIDANHKLKSHMVYLHSER